MYLSARTIHALEPTRKAHFLNPDAIRLNRSLGDAVGLERLGVHLITVPPGHYSTEYHRHHYEEECIYVLSGGGIATLGGERQRVAQGDFLGFPANGIAHDMYNDGDVDLVCLVAGQRLEQDVVDYPGREKRLYRNSGEWNLVDYAAIEKVRR